MIRITRSTGLTALAVATAVFIAPVAYSGGKLATFAQRGLPASSQLAAKQQASTDRFIVTYRDGGARLTAATRNEALSKAAVALGVRIRPVRTLATGASLIRTERKLGRAAAKRLMIELLKDPNVRAVDIDARVKPAFVPNDPLYTQQWHYGNGAGGINLEPAWDLSQGDGVVVAVLDTGITAHSELDGQKVAGYDFIADIDTAVDGDGRDADPSDPGDWHDGECNIFGIPEDSSWHGTHVAGTVAAATNNGAGVAGVAPGARVQPVRVLGKCGGFFSDIVDAVTWASGGSVANVPDNATPAEVINLSLGGGGACPVAMQDAIDGAVSRGTTIVTAAGNGSSDVAGHTPSNCENVIAVSAVGPTGALAGYSNFGNLVDVAAPGGSGVAPAEDNVLSTLNLGTQGPTTEGYAWYAGTSMAAPHVAGTVALMQAAADTPKTPDVIEEILENTAYANGGFAGGCSYDKPCGTGIIDARAAIAVANGSEPLPPDPPPPPPPPPGIPLQNGVVVTGIQVAQGTDIVYELQVPNGASQLFFGMSGGTGDADMYVRRGQRPTDTAYDCRPFRSGNEETCYFPAPESGTYYVRIKGFSAATGVSLYPSFVDANWPRGEAATVTQLSGHRTRVLLTWDAGKRQVDIYRDGAIYATTRNTGAYTDIFRIVGTGTKTYMICNKGTEECSDEVEIEFNSRR
ncbi:S8 family peptidase [Lysobacter sp. M15]|uniref:S8 family peptidase n=1 Tax=Lysobacter sp. M15 TaxID=2916837 RepID=UPI001F5A1282|nr:S8 family peptidase [Lysobacter sp. M15]